MNFEISGMRELAEEVSDLKELLMMVLANSDAKLVITATQIAEKEGCSKAALSPSGKERYLLPRFGESGYPDGPRRWDVEEYLEWRKIPKAERKRMYKEHLAHQRAAYIESQDGNR